MAKKSTGIVSSILIGGAIGSVLGMMYAPEKGEKNRKKALSLSRKYLNKGKKTSLNVWGKLKEFYDKQMAKQEANKKRLESAEESVTNDAEKKDA